MCNSALRRELRIGNFALRRELHMRNFALRRELPTTVVCAGTACGNSRAGDRQLTGSFGLVLG